MSRENILSRWDSVAISVGIVIGVGIFRVPAEVAHHLASADLILLAWFAGGIVSFLGALCYAELASRFPSSGGDYIYLKEAYGKITAFLFAWSELLITRTGSVAAIALMFGEYATALFGWSGQVIKPLSISIVLLLAVLNLYGLRRSSRLQNIFTVTKVVALAVIIVAGMAGLVSGGKTTVPAFHFGTSQMNFDWATISMFGVALVPILWTYGGWRDNVFLAGETKEAETSIPFALLTTCGVVTAIYVAMNFLYLSYIPVEKLKDAPLVASDLLLALFGEGGAKLLEALIVIYGLGAINALLLTGSRIGHAMSHDNPLFGTLSKVNENTGVPVRSLVFNALWSCVLVLTGTFEKLLFFTGLAVWIFFAMVALAIPIIRMRAAKASAPGELKASQFFNVPAYPLTPLLVAVISLGLAASTIMYYPWESLMGTILVGAGVPLYFMQRLRKTKNVL